MYSHHILHILIATSLFFISLIKILLPSPYIIFISHGALSLIYIGIGGLQIWEAIKSATLEKKIGINFLMISAAIGSFFLGEIYEGALLFVLFYIANKIEAWMLTFAENAIESTSHAIQKKTKILKGSKEIEMPNEEIEVGSHIVIAPYQMIPIDGCWVSGGKGGISFVSLTGEPSLQKIIPNIPILSGSVNGPTRLILKTSTIYMRSHMKKLEKAILYARDKKPVVQTDIEYYLNFYLYFLISSVAIGSFVAHFIFELPFFGEGGIFYRSIGVITFGSPCALMLSYPISQLVMLGLGLQKGCFLFNMASFEKLHTVDHIVFDKTGTLTEGELSCCEYQILKNDKNYSLKQIASFVEALERYSSHPFSISLLKWASLYTNKPLQLIDDLEEIPGYGIKGSVFLGGNLMSIQIGSLSAASQQSDKSQMSTYLRSEEDLLVQFVIADRLRSDAKETVNYFVSQNVEMSIASGANLNSVQKVGDFLGIKNIYAPVSPYGKECCIENLQKENARVCMVEC